MFPDGFEKCDSNATHFLMYKNKDHMQVFVTCKNCSDYFLSKKYYLNNIYLYIEISEQKYKIIKKTDLLR